MVEPRFLELNQNLAASIQDAIDKTFETIFHMPTRMDLYHVGRDIPLNLTSSHAAQIVLSDKGVPFGVFIAAFNRPLLLRVLNLSEGGQDQAMLEDAVSEITNMIYGLFKTTVNGEGYTLTMGIPQLLKEADIASGTLQQSEKLHLHFSADGQACWIAIAQYH